MTRLEEIKERCEKAPEGPWGITHNCQTEGHLIGREPGSVFQAFGVLYCTSQVECTDNVHGNVLDTAEFIANSREDIPWLVSQLEKAIEVIQFYSLPSCAQLDQDIEFHESKSLTEPYEFPFGTKARELLDQMK